MELAKKLDIYTLQNDDMNWNLSLLMTDSKGNPSIFEVIDGKATAFEDRKTTECSAYSPVALPMELRDG